MFELKEYYTKKEEVMAALAEYNKGRPESERKYYIYQFNDYTQQKMYIVCDREFFYFYRNMKRNEMRQRDIESRCLVPSDHFGWKKCMENCNNCPYGKLERDGKPLSLDFTYTNLEGDEYGIKIEDDSPSVVEEMIEEERHQTLKQLLEELEPKDRRILELFAEGKSDNQIATELGSHRTTIMSRRSKLIAELKIKIEK